MCYCGYKRLPNNSGTNLQKPLWFIYRKTVTILKWHLSGWPTPVDSCTVWNNTAARRWEYQKEVWKVDSYTVHNIFFFFASFRHLWLRTQANRTNTAWRILTWQSTDRCWVTFPSRSISSSSRWLKESYSQWLVSYIGYTPFSLWSFSHFQVWRWLIGSLLRQQLATS